MNGQYARNILTTNDYRLPTTNLIDMKESRNTLIIESLSTEVENGEYGFYVKAKMTANINFCCSVNGALFRSVNITSEGSGYSHNESLRDAIQNFMNGKLHAENHYYNREAKSLASNKIHHVDIQMGEPYKSIFEQLFDLSRMEMPQLSN